MVKVHILDCLRISTLTKGLLIQALDNLSNSWVLLMALASTCMISKWARLAALLSSDSSRIWTNRLPWGIAIIGMRGLGVKTASAERQVESYAANLVTVRTCYLRIAMTWKEKTILPLSKTSSPPNSTKSFWSSILSSNINPKFSIPYWPWSQAQKYFPTDS